MLSRGARTTARSSGRLLPRQQRRLDSHHTPHGHGESALHVAGGAGNESIGRGFFISLALLPMAAVVYSIAASSDSLSLTKIINAYREREDETVRRNALHSAAIEQAAEDRHLFNTDPIDSVGVDLRFPETFNSGAPWNVVAGEGGADLSKLMEHYSQRDKKMEGDRLARRVEGKVVTVYDDTTGGRFPTWMPFVATSKAVKPGYKE